MRTNQERGLGLFWQRRQNCVTIATVMNSRSVSRSYKHACLLSDSQLGLVAPSAPQSHHHHEQPQQQFLRRPEQQPDNSGAAPECCHCHGNSHRWRKRGAWRGRGQGGRGGTEEESVTHPFGAVAALPHSPPFWRHAHLPLPSFRLLTSSLLPPPSHRTGAGCRHPLPPPVSCYRKHAPHPLVLLYLTPLPSPSCRRHSSLSPLLPFTTSTSPIPSPRLWPWLLPKLPQTGSDIWRPSSPLLLHSLPCPLLLPSLPPLTRALPLPHLNPSLLRLPSLLALLSLLLLLWCGQARLCAPPPLLLLFIFLSTFVLPPLLPLPVSHLLCGPAPPPPLPGAWCSGAVWGREGGGGGGGGGRWRGGEGQSRRRWWWKQSSSHQTGAAAGESVNRSTKTDQQIFSLKSMRLLKISFVFISLSVSFSQATPPPIHCYSNRQEVALRHCSWFVKTRQPLVPSQPIRRKDKLMDSVHWFWDSPTVTSLQLKPRPRCRYPISPWCCSSRHCLLKLRRWLLRLLSPWYQLTWQLLRFRWRRRAGGATARRTPAWTLPWRRRRGPANRQGRSLTSPSTASFLTWSLTSSQRRPIPSQLTPPPPSHPTQLCLRQGYDTWCPPSPLPPRPSSPSLTRYPPPPPPAWPRSPTSPQSGPTPR